MNANMPILNKLLKYPFEQMSGVEYHNNQTIIHNNEGCNSMKFQNPKMY